VQEVFFTLENEAFVYEVKVENRMGKVAYFTIPAAIATDPNAVLSFEKAFLRGWASTSGKEGKLIRDLYKALEAFPSRDQNFIRKHAWNVIIEKVEDVAQDGTQRSLEVLIQQDFIDFVKEAKATPDWEEFTSNDSFVKYVDEDGRVYVRFRSLFRALQRLSPLKNTYTEKKVFKLLRSIGAQVVRIQKQGKRTRLWLLPEGDWILPSTEEEKVEVPEVQPDLDLDFGKVKVEVQEKAKEEVKKEVKEEKREEERREDQKREVKNDGNGNEKKELEDGIDFTEVDGEFLKSQESWPEWFKKEWEAMEKECKCLNRFEDVPF